MAALIRGKDDLVAGARTAKYTDLAAAYGWPIIAGTARFGGDPAAPRLEVAPAGEGGPLAIGATHYLVATGSAPRVPPIPGLDESGYLTSTTAMELTSLPESMAVIGGNAVGLELGQMFARLGTRVTIIEALDRLAPFDEPEISAAIRDVLDDEDIDVVTGAAVTGVRTDGPARSVLLKTAGGERELTCGQILVAAGRRPATEGLNLAAVGVRTGGRGQIVTDARQRATNPRIWAAGDVTGGPPYVYTAAAQGSAAAGNALFDTGQTVDYTALPRVTFTGPAMASAGLTEAELLRSGVTCDCRVLPLEAVPRAIVNRDTRGVVKLVAEAGTGRIRGVHAVADGAGELITAGVYAIRTGMTVKDLAGTWAPYLTMSEALRLAAQAFGRDVTKLSCCAA